ncbi:DNA polymerase III subunit beta [Eubacteriales bacterium DFI.9.88]|uniref:DNA polymerase III subunit beta n=1 Tax=Hominibacterium faecale TaxID=2839743 RepID=UPI0022B292C7|nr:DNA polymerase III subunit beta [Hominibacterium faecale]MDE8733181.1 DNA polymerase III subunit beta [Eubacteriales bacterium DFI.9.88]
MKFTCSQQSLSKALNTVSKAVTSRTTIPILKGILLKASSDGTLTLSASDLDLSIEKKIDVNVEEEGSIVVLSKLFSDIIRKLPNEDILIEEKENNNVLIKTASSEFTIVGLAADEFPNISELEGQPETLSFDKEIFKDMVRKTSFAASIDESKGIIVGVLLEIEPDTVNMVALDGFRMAVAREPMKSAESTKIVVAAKILNEINKIVSEAEDEGDIQIMLSNKKAVILVETTKIVIRLLEGEFIKYKDIIPTQNQTKVEVGRAVLLESIERASLLAKEGKNNLIKLTIKNNLLTITSRSEEGNVKEEIVMEKTGEDLEIGFNSKYVIDVLKAVSDEQVLMEFNTSTTPCLVKPLIGNTFEYLILPVRIASNY